MSTRAVITIKDEYDTFHIYRHGDGYPDGEQGTVASIEAAKKFAWPLPRFEASDFAAAYVRANKTCGGNIHLTSSYEDRCDLNWRYEVTHSKARGLDIAIFAHTEDGDDTKWVRRQESSL